MITIINLTEHDVVIQTEDDRKVVIKPSGQVARVSAEMHTIGTLEIDGIPVRVRKTVFGEVTGLPERKDETTVYVVSSLVAQARKERDDLFAPDTAPDSAVRDEEKRIIAVRGLQVFS